VLAVITKHVPPAVAVPFFAFVVLGEIWANYLDVYTAGLVTLTMGLRLRRWQTAILCGVAGTVLAALATTIFDFHTLYEDFLILTYLWAPAWAAVVLLSFFVVGDARPGPALFAWILGTLLSLAFVNYANLFSNASQLAGFRPNQGLVNALHGADLSGLVSVVVAAGAYLLLRRLRAAPQVVGA
jgi:NCS1 family nucleobase:cation symporter-1